MKKEKEKNTHAKREKAVSSTTKKAQSIYSLFDYNEKFLKSKICFFLQSLQSNIAKSG